MGIHFNENFRPSAGAIILTPEGVVMVREKKENFSHFPLGQKVMKKTFYKLPGGKFNISLDSDIRDTAIRETREETGVEIFHQRDQMSLADVILRHGFRHSVFFISLPFIPVLGIKRNEIEDVKIVSPTEWKEMREGNDILLWHAFTVEKELPEFRGYIEPAYA